MQIKAAIFDVDGTLLDSLGIWEKADEEYLSRRGIKPEKGLGRILYPMTVEEASAISGSIIPWSRRQKRLRKACWRSCGNFMSKKRR